MKPTLRQLMSRMRPGTRSLKTTLALYFVPVSILPTLCLSFYAIDVYQDQTRDSFLRRASSERDAIVGELDTLEADLLAQAKTHSIAPRLREAMRRRDADAIASTFASYRPGVTYRAFTGDGHYLAGKRAPESEARVAYISKEGLRRVKTRGETLERYFGADSKGFITLIRCLVQERGRVIGILEEEYRYGTKDLAALKNRRQVDVIFLDRQFNAVAASFALSDDVVKNFSLLAFQSGAIASKAPVTVQFGDNRYAAFLYDVPAPLGRQKQWGYVAVFLSMTAADASVLKLKAAMVYVTALLILVSALVIFVFSNRLVRPIERLVLAMKRVKTGRVDQIPPIDSAYEVEYLVHSFNEMARNVSAAKRTLEMKLDELRDANEEIKDTQSQLVQSAKMVSLGQIVAGVAHELNNPIGFIYSNMHHLNDYVAKIRELVELYRKLQTKLPPDARKQIESLEAAIEVDFILKDMLELTKSCVEGATRTKEIVLGLRNFSRMEESTFRPADLHEGLRNTVRLLVSEMKDRITVHEEFGDVPQVECNPSQMNQVFMNLLSNATQAIGPKGDIWIRTRVEGVEAVVEIEDSGSGMPHDTLDKIFDPFFTTKKVGEGTGLGLSIAYGIVQKHGGTIQVSSRLGKGTCFVIRLPVRQPGLQAG